MNRNQAADKTTMDKGKTREGGGNATADKSKGHHGKAGDKSGKPGSVLGEINDDPKKKSK